MPDLAPPDRPDALRPTAAAALAAWAERVARERDQVERLREVADPADYYAPCAGRFVPGPAGEVAADPVAAWLVAEVMPGARWLDVGAGGGRYALPLARAGARVTAIEPSPAMRATLVAAAAGVGDALTVRDGRWPDAALPGVRADVALIAHVSYDIAAIGPFLDALEAAADRCIAVMGEGAMTTAAQRFWAPVHGEPRVPLPALPELLALLLARGRLPEVTCVPRTPPVFPDPAALRASARRQLWLAEGSAKDAHLGRLLGEGAVAVPGGWTIDPVPTRIGIVRWSGGAA